MDTLHTVLRAIRGETKARRDHLTVFREFLGHLDRIGRRTPVSRTPVRPARGQPSSSRGKR
jgi:hypothetical protein